MEFALILLKDSNVIKIYTFAHKRPDFIELQLKSFEKNLENEYEFIVYNNAVFDKDRTHYNQIQNICKKHNIKCIDVQRDNDLIAKLKSYNNEHIFNGEGMYFNAVIACAYPLCYAWKHNFSSSNDKICIIDSDMFIVEKENFANVLNQYDIMCQLHSRGPNGEVYYIWNGFVLMNLNNLENKSDLVWWCGYVNGYPVDVGGQTFHYLEKNKDKIKIGGLVQHYIGEDPNCDFSPANYEYFEFGNSVRSILHHRGGSNWHSCSKDYVDRKTIWLKKQIDK